MRRGIGVAGRIESLRSFRVWAWMVVHHKSDETGDSESAVLSSPTLPLRGSMTLLLFYQPILIHLLRRIGEIAERRQGHRLRFPIRCSVGGT